MISSKLDPSSMASLIIAFSILSAVMLAYIVAIRILQQQERVKSSLQSLESREFHSSNEEWREKLEKDIAEINRRLTDTQREFVSVNHLLFDAANAEGPINSDAKNLDPATFLRNMEIPANAAIRNDLVFVLTPFENRELATFAAIVEALSVWGLKVLRGDEQKVSSNILSHVVGLIAQARIVIANVSSRNPNVMYELGIAHAMGKSVIMIATTIDDVPFDLRHQRVLLYKSRDDLIAKLRENVGSVLFNQSS